MTDHVLEHFLDLPEAQPNNNGNAPHAVGETYIWITRWEDFQHYRPERDRAPAWIKTYTKQLDDERYLNLTVVQRALLHDLRIAFPKAHGRLSKDTRQLSQRTGLRVTKRTLEALNHAGFIEFISRQTLEQRLEKLYSPPRARVEVEVEVEKEPLNPRRRGDLNRPSQKTQSSVCPHCELGGGQHLEDCPTVQPPPRTAELLPALSEDGF